MHALDCKQPIAVAAISNTHQPFMHNRSVGRRDGHKTTQNAAYISELKEFIITDVCTEKKKERDNRLSFFLSSRFNGGYLGAPWAPGHDLFVAGDPLQPPGACRLRTPRGLPSALGVLLFRITSSLLELLLSVRTPNP